MRNEDGFTAFAAVVTLLIVTLFAGSALGFGLRAIDSSRRDRSSARALAGADAGADRVAYLLNRIILPSLMATESGMAVGDLHELGCITVSASGTYVIDTGTIAPGGTVGSASYCDQEFTGQLDASTSYSVRTSLKVELGTSLPETLVRRLVATGSSGSVKRRILVTYYLDLDAAGSATDLFRRRSYVECTAEPTGSSPESGCPVPPL